MATDSSGSSSTSSKGGAEEMKDFSGTFSEKSSDSVTARPKANPSARSALIGQDLRTLSQWSLRLVFVAAATLVLYKLIGFLWVGILPTILAITICAALWPLVGWLINHRLPSWLASAGTLLVFLGLISGVLGAIAPSIRSQIGPLAQNAVEGIQKLQVWLLGPPFRINRYQLDEATKYVTAKIQSSASQIASVAINGVGAASSVLITLVITLMLCFFFLKDGKKVLPWTERVIGEPAFTHVKEVSTRSWDTVGGFIRTQAVVSSIDAIFIFAGMVILGVPLAGPLAIITFLGGFVPIVGAFVSGFLAVVAATVGVSVKAGVIMLVVIIVVQQLEGNVLTPVLQSNAMNLHPVVVLLVVFAGGSLFGIVGAFLAVPITSVVAVIARYVVESWDERACLVYEEEPPEVPDTRFSRWVKDYTHGVMSTIQEWEPRLRRPHQKSPKDADKNSVEDSEQQSTTDSAENSAQDSV